MKKCLFNTLVCLMLFSACAWPLPACAKSGSSTCQVTATAGETPPPSEPGDGDTGEPEKPDPGDGPEELDPGNGQPEEPDTGKEPSEKPDNPGEGDGEAEPGIPGTTPGPGDTASEPDGPGPVPGQGGKPEPGEGQETTPAESTEPPGEGTDLPQQPETEPSGEPETHGGWFWRLLAALSLLCFLAAAGVFRFCWMWLLFVFFKKSRRQFHGILTEEKNFFIRIRDARDSSRLVQEIIDGAGSLAECREEIMKEAAVTEIPRQSRMRISYPGSDGRRRCRDMAADEEKMFRFLEKLHGAGDVEARITCRGTGIDISLHFCL